VSTAPRKLRVACLMTGSEEYAAAVVRALAPVADVLMLAPLAWAERYAGDLPVEVRLRPLPWYRHRDPRNLTLVWRVIAQLRSFRPDVVHCIGDSVVWLLLALPWLRRQPLVVTVHDIAYHPGDVQSQRVPMATVRRLRRAADAVIVHGDGLAKGLAQTGIRPRAGIHAVPHPVLDRYARLAGSQTDRQPNDRARLLFFGRVMAYKGLAVLIAASDRLIERFPDLEIVVAGKGPELDRLAPELARRPFFTVHDAYIPDAAVAGLFRRADLLLLPYVEASQSGVAALAAAFGTPVVASDVGELGELVRITGMGHVVPPGDAAALEAAVTRLLADAELRRTVAAASRAAAAGPMAPAAVASRTLAVYAAARSQHGAGRAQANDGGGAMPAGRNMKL
jgi:glycosyltransferase involved in cell wall biosynthesis